MFFPKKKIVVLFMNFGPYHIARLEALGDVARSKGFQVYGIEINQQSRTYGWKVKNASHNFYWFTIFEGDTIAKASLLRQVKSVWTVLQSLSPDVIVSAGYREAAMVTALAWAKINRGWAVIMGDSKADGFRRNFIIEFGKRLLVSHFDAALVAGRPQLEYFHSLGIPQTRIFTGYNVVDNDFFGGGSARARKQEKKMRMSLELPRPFFIAVCRFIPEKNLYRLLEAYQLYRSMIKERPWDLVLCGSGPLSDKIQNIASDLIGVHLTGFIQSDTLVTYYGLASALILPSISETWGLAVNEAMASGLPVLVSRACGCAQDLVQEGVNGFTFDPYDVEGLARLMVKMSSGEVNLQALGEASLRLIADWTPEVFAQNLFKALNAALACRQTRKPWWLRFFASS